MSITWGYIKEASLRKLFALSSEEIRIDSNTKEYLLAMPQACNEALGMLATVGKFLTDKKTFIIEPRNNLLSGTDEDMMFDDERELAFEAEGARSYYFKATKGVTARIYIGGSLAEEISCTEDNYSPYKGLISNAGRDTVSLVFITQYPAHVANVALYSATYASADDVPANEEVQRFNLKQMIPDFYQIYAGQVFIERNGTPSYLSASEYYTEANDTIVFRTDRPGVYTVHYKKYVAWITKETEDDFELPLDPEVAAIIPLYIASQLYKEDDNGIATTYRNEFETAFDRLKQRVEVPEREEFSGESGWV